MDHHDWQIVRATPLFGALSREVGERLIEGPGARAFEKGVQLFEQGAPADAFYVVLEGWVKIYRSTADGHEVVLHLFRQGETFGEAVIFMGGRYPVSAETATACRLLRFSGKRLRQCILDDPQVALTMLASASQHLKVLVEQLEQMKRLSAPQRLADFLIRLRPTAEGSCTIGLPYEKSLIASRLGMQPESLSRTFVKLRTLGVHVVRDEVMIEDLGRLRAFIDATGDDDSP